MSDYPYIEGKRVLIVDDETDVLDSLEDLLGMCQLTRASSFADARELLENRFFNIVILDIMGVGGYELLEIATAKHVTAVMLTAHAFSPENLMKSYRGGAASYLPKEEMVNIASFLNEIIEASQEGKNPWTRWYDRMGSFLEKRFGADWQKQDQAFWERFPFY